MSCLFFYHIVQELFIIQAWLVNKFIKIIRENPLNAHLDDSF